RVRVVLEMRRGEVDGPRRDRHRAEDEQTSLDGGVRLEAPMRQQPVVPDGHAEARQREQHEEERQVGPPHPAAPEPPHAVGDCEQRSEEHTSELQSRGHLVCRLLLEKKKRRINWKTAVYRSSRRESV